ncbi:hypothetical protein F4808DRAFT_466319 [Astrocystis sublimbata]|nr:hypothetical protein F4808DRAFT_466319 [Astrocystis sublimbata]
MASIAAQQMHLGLSNNTISPASPMGQSQNTFSRANVFGLFLTLILCLLVQPYGSLLYQKPTSIVGRSIFFFWRLNPVGCVLEAALLAVAVIDGIIVAVRAPHDPAEGHHYKAIVIEDARLSIAEATSRDRANEATAPLSSTRVDTGTGHGNGLPYNDDTSPVSSLDITDRQSVRTAVSTPTTRGPSQIEAGQGDHPPSETISLTSPRFRIGRNFVPHAEHVIDLVGTIAVIIVIIKLAAVTIPSHIRVPAWFMVAGWIAIQALVFMSPRREHSHVNPEHVIRRAVKLERRLFQPFTWIFFTLLLLPLFGYLTHVWLFQAPAISIKFRTDQVF